MYNVHYFQGFSDTMKGIASLGLLSPDDTAALHPKGPETTWVSLSFNVDSFLSCGQTKSSTLELLYRLCLNPDIGKRVLRCPASH